MNTTPEKTSFSILLISVILFLIYLNSFNADWHMDDRPNIVNNRAVQIENLMPDQIRQTLYASPIRSDTLYRPLAYLTFGINWYIGQDNPIGYHIVNLGFHIGTAIAVYFLFIRLLSLLYKVEENEYAHVSNVALFAAVLWAINPIQVQSVTYIVQRMAVMAAFFYVLSILYYVKARTAVSIWRQYTYVALCFLWFLCAMGSKENAVMLPIILVLIEWVFFQKARTDFLKWPATWFVAVGVAAAAIVSALLLTAGNPLETMQGWYSSRPFSFEERLMSQPRIVLEYLSQIFYPLPDRFSIAHDVTTSKSLFDPWTTMPAIGIIFALIIAPFFFARRFPLLSFAVLFFFFNHLIESSIFPIELVFEHRNYLPSLFLFLPVSAGLCSLLLKLRKENILLHSFMALAMAFLIVGVGLSTYTRNQAWATGITLWSDAAQKAPNHVRPIVTLGIRLAWQDNPTDADYNFALRLFHHALELPDAARKSEKAEILGNIASIYFHRGENDKAIATYLEAIESDPSFLKNRSDLIKPLIVKGDFEKAAFHAKYLVEKRPNNQSYLSTKGFILLWQDKPDEALSYFQKALARGPHRPNLLLNTGVALTRVESLENGRWFFQQAIKKSRGDLLPMLAMIENRTRAGDANRAAIYARHAISRYPVPVIYNRLENAGTDYRSAPISTEYIEPSIKNELETSAFRFQ